MMRNLKTMMLAGTLIALAAGAALADTPQNLSLYNATLPADVDSNGKVDVTDVNLVFDVLRSHQAQPLVAPLETESPYLWDTSGNGRVNSQDALVVINYLLLNPVPEPTTVVTAGLALAGFAGLCWRRRKAVATRS